MIEAESSDGVVHEFPDGTPPEAIDRAMKQYAKQSKGGLMGAVNLLGASILRGAAKAGDAAAVGDPVTAAGQEWVGEPQLRLGGRDALINEQGSQPRPGSNVDRYLTAAGEGIGGSLLMPVAGAGRPAVTALGSFARSAAPTVGYGAVGGVGGQGAVDFMEGDERWRVAGALGAGAGTAMAMPGRLFGNKYDLAAKLMETLPPGVRDAFRGARQANVPIHLGQAAGTPETQAVMDILANAEPQIGANTRQVIAGQPSAVLNALDTELQRTGGQRLPLREMENNAQSAATRRIQEFRDAMNRGFSRRVGNAGDRPLGPNDLSFARAQMEQLRDNNPFMAPALAPIIAGLENQSIQTVGQLDDQLKAGIRQIGSRGSLDTGTDARTIDTVTGALTRERDVLAANRAPEYLRARDRFASQGETFDELNKSSIGRIAAGGAEDMSESTGNRLQAILKAGRDPALPMRDSEILFTAKELNKVDPTVFRNGVVTHLSNEIGKATVRDGDNVLPETITNVNKALFGNDVKRQGTLDAITGIAQGYRIPNPERAARGFQNLMETVSRVSRQPINTGEIGLNVLATAQKSKVGKIVRVPYLGNVGGWVDRFYGNNTLKEIDKLIGSESGLRELQILADYPPGSPQLDAAVRTLLAAQGSDQPTQE